MRWRERAEVAGLAAEQLDDEVVAVELFRILLDVCETTAGPLHLILQKSEAGNSLAGVVHEMFTDLVPVLSACRGLRGHELVLV